MTSIFTANVIASIFQRGSVNCAQATYTVARLRITQHSDNFLIHKEPKQDVVQQFVSCEVHCTHISPEFR